LSAARKRPAIVRAVCDWIRAGDVGVVLYTRKAQADMLYAELMKRKADLELELRRPVTLLHATGDTPDEEFEHNKALLFSSTGTTIMVGTIDKLAIGIDGMQKSVNKLGIAALPWNHYKVTQAEGRPDRIGHSGRTSLGVDIVYFEAEGTMDEEIRAVVLDKLHDANEILSSDDLGAMLRDLTGAEDDEDLIARLARRLMEHEEASGGLPSADELDFHHSPEAAYLAAGDIVDHNDEPVKSNVGEEDPDGF